MDLFQSLSFLFPDEQSAETAQPPTTLASVEDVEALADYEVRSGSSRGGATFYCVIS